MKLTPAKGGNLCHATAATWDAEADCHQMQEIRRRRKGNTFCTNIWDGLGWTILLAHCQTQSTLAEWNHCSICDHQNRKCYMMFVGSMWTCLWVPFARRCDMICPIWSRFNSVDKLNQTNSDHQTKHLNACFWSILHVFVHGFQNLEPSSSVISSLTDCCSQPGYINLGSTWGFISRSKHI